ncbi:hypothetical protein MIND_00695400 [Mycena indigotica]|uniref:3-keto sterol reductase n=1 Tax=Mycena indigotica TaxID=2126181 RepID=A0A8H6W0S7_9AGAR|nr:uncharacterized protein MIND_00695400 [Mycena indigotica]KAF7301304.1 hypothetical protein MIND_00695400 [Mycena indigotica]
MASFPVIVVTGANAGVGFGVCQRLLYQLCSSNPPDSWPQPWATRANALALEPPTGNGLVLILACRSVKRAEEARDELYHSLDAHIKKLRKHPEYDGYADEFRHNLTIEVEYLDLARLDTVFDFSSRVSQRHPYVSHLICNAGYAPFSHIIWPAAIRQLCTNFLETVTKPVFYAQTFGELTSDGLGHTFQCNFFGHYVLFRTLEPLLKNTAYSADSRVIWCSSLEASPKFYDQADWQHIKNHHPYESTKYQIDLTGTILDLQSLQNKIVLKRVRHFVSQPGVAHTKISTNLVAYGGFIDGLKLVLFYLARLFNTRHHSIAPINAAIATVHLSLVALSFITFSQQKPNEKPEFEPVRFGAETTRLGEAQVGLTPVLGWEQNQKLAESPEYPSPPNYIAASHLPTTLHPYLHPGPNASRSSQDISTVPINQDSYSLHSLSASVHNLAGTVTLNVQDATTSRPASYLAPSPVGSARSSLDVQIQVETESPAQSRNPSFVHLETGDAVEPVAEWLNQAYPRIFPGTPESFSRYSRRRYVGNEETNFNIPPLTVGGKANNPSEEWQTCSHPEGAPYFHHSKNVGSDLNDVLLPPMLSQRVFTDADLFDPEALEWINRQMKTILDFLRARNITPEEHVDLVLDEYFYSDDSRGCQYYFVNHSSRCIFWMDSVNSELFEVAKEVNGISSASHIRHILEAQYWYHCDLFPLSLNVTPAIVDELRDIVLHSIGDLITSSTSTVSWKIDQLNDMSRLVDGLTKNVGKSHGKKLSGTSCLVGRLMQEFVRARVYNFHGEPGARLNVDQSVYDVARRRTLLIKLLSPLLFYAPDFHLDGLHTIFTDGLVRHRGWSEFVSRLTGEWQEFTLYATVVLNANVAFLSIQSVDTDGQSTPHRTPTQIASYMSMLTSIGAIIVGLLLLKQNRNRDRVPAPEAASYMSNRTHPTLGLETLAILYSLPYAMLIWSMVSFLAAFSFLCFLHADLKTRALSAVIWGAVAALILWCAVNGWEKGMGDWEWPFLSRLFGTKDEEPEAEEDDDDEKSTDEVKKETASVASRSKSRTWRWRWPSISIPGRKSSLDSDETAV